MDRVEEVLSSAGDLLLQASVIAQQNAAAIDRLGQRVDSLTAASEQHDRILDYLLRREAGNDAGEPNGN